MPEDVPSMEGLGVCGLRTCTPAIPNVAIWTAKDDVPFVGAVAQHIRLPRARKRQFQTSEALKIISHHSIGKALIEFDWSAKSLRSLHTNG